MYVLRALCLNPFGFCQGGKEQEKTQTKPGGFFHNNSVRLSRINSRPMLHGSSSPGVPYMRLIPRIYRRSLVGLSSLLRMSCILHISDLFVASR